jgi:hypothetical protein
MVVVFEETIDMLTKGNEMKKAYTDYLEYCIEDGYIQFHDNSFKLRLESALNKLSTSKNTTRHIYYRIKDNVKNKYSEIEIKKDLDDVAYDS